MTLLALPRDFLHSSMEEVWRVWDAHFKAARRGGFDRIDIGRLRAKRQVAGGPGAPPKLCEQGFLKRRRADVAKRVTPDVGKQPLRAEDLPQGAWTEGHVREREFQHKKRRARAVECLAANSLLPEDIDADLLREAAAATAKLRTARCARAKKEAVLARRARAGQLPVPAELVGAKVSAPLSIVCYLARRFSFRGFHTIGGTDFLLLEAAKTQCHDIMSGLGSTEPRPVASGSGSLSPDLCSDTRSMCQVLLLTN